MRLSERNKGWKNRWLCFGQDKVDACVMTTPMRYKTLAILLRIAMPESSYDD
jgi:hypothetical protein